MGGQHVEEGNIDGEGCQLTGSVRISRVPGNLRISAASSSHSFNTHGEWFLPGGVWGK